MKRVLISFALLMTGVSALAQDKIPAHPHIRVETTEGSFLLELEGKRAPITVANFLKLVADGYFDGTVFHRVIPDFMVQGGGFGRSLKLKEPEGTIPNESGNGLTNMRGTIAMARQKEPHTAMAQFFINLVDNRSLDPKRDRWGYAVFGYVIEGMEVVDKMAAVRTGPGGQFASDVPVVPIVIEKMTLVE